jgi:RimJ/RimL family protein N-acetyltransferase
VSGPDAAFVQRHTVDVVLASGRRVRVRPVVPEDREGLAEGVRRMSLESRYRRFFSAVPELPEAALTYLTEIDYDDHFAWAAVDLDQPGAPGIGVARYIRLPDDPEAAEVAVAVADDHHRLGIGTLLLEAVALTAREHGIRRLVATVLSDNQAGRSVLRGLGATFRWDPDGGVLRVEMPVPDGSQGIRDTRLYDALRAAAQGQVFPLPAPPPAGES